MVIVPQLSSYHSIIHLYCLINSHKIEQFMAMWKKVDTSKHDFGDLGDSVFCGLEEIDWNDYVKTKGSVRKGDFHIGTDQQEQEAITYETTIADSDFLDDDGVINSLDENEKKPKAKKKKNKKDKKDKESIAKEDLNALEPKRPLKRSVTDVIELHSKETHTSTKKIKMELSNSINPDSLVLTPWGSKVFLPFCIVNSLNALGFIEPTPIQNLSIPIIMKNTADIVGAAVTGSGKTLAFALPVLSNLLYNWSSISNSRKPFAIIFTPTRELAIQISTVIKSICEQKEFQLALGSQRIEIVNIIGGMSEQKQQRQVPFSLSPFLSFILFWSFLYIYNFILFTANSYKCGFSILISIFNLSPSPLSYSPQFLFICSFLSSCCCFLVKRSSACSYYSCDAWSAL